MTPRNRAHDPLILGSLTPFSKGHVLMSGCTYVWMSVSCLRVRAIWSSGSAAALPLATSTVAGAAGPRLSELKLTFGGGAKMGIRFGTLVNGTKG